MTQVSSTGLNLSPMAFCYTSFIDLLYQCYLIICRFSFMLPNIWIAFLFCFFFSSKHHFNRIHNRPKREWQNTNKYSILTTGNTFIPTQWHIKLISVALQSKCVWLSLGRFYSSYINFGVYISLNPLITSHQRRFLRGILLEHKINKQTNFSN